MAIDESKATQHPNDKTPSLTVLIADDDPPTRILLKAAISQWGYKVIAAQDGEEAWNILQHPDAPKLIILDWLMPKMNGIDLCVKMKQELAYKPYTILLTQVTGTENIVKGLEAGADEFLSKPFNMAELNSRLSVGARIIHFENKLAEQNHRLEHLLQQITKLVQLTPEITLEVDQLLISADGLEQSAKQAIHLAKLKDLQQHQAKLIDLMESLKAN
jgi:sigma-B regulation protein RsbU (phosphoserine phosphatase)